MQYPLRQLDPSEFPPLLQEITDPPKSLFIRGALPSFEAPWLCVVGSRKYSPYGKSACEKLIEGLRGTNIVIVSGLALGIDSIAHQAALSAGLLTVAVPGSGLGENVLYPRSNVGLAHEILEQGGALLSEFAENFRATVWSFPQRNRIMAGISRAVLLIEAEEKSGTLITARLATDYNRDVLAVPGSIFSESSKGPHLFMRLGATPITSSNDLLDALGIKKKDAVQSAPLDLNETEKELYEALAEPLEREELALRLTLPSQEISILLSSLELRGIVRERMGKFERI